MDIGRWYAAWLGALAIGMVAGLPRAQLLRLAVVSSVGFAVWGWFDYHAYTGWYFRCRLWRLYREMSAFARGARRKLVEALLPPRRDQYAELQILLGRYQQQFHARLAPLLAECVERGCISEEVAARFRVPQSVEQIAVNAEELRTLALRYRRY